MAIKPISLKPPPKPKRALIDYLREIGRGEYAVMDLLADVDPERAWYQQLYKPLRAPGEEPSFERWLELQGMEKGWPRTGLGIAGGVAVDPLTWATLGFAPVARAGGKALQIGARVPFVGKKTIPLVRSQAAYKALAKVGRTVGAAPGIRHVRGLFTTPARRILPFAPEAVHLEREALGITQGIREGMEQFWKGVAKSRDAIGKRWGLGSRATGGWITQVVESSVPGLARPERLAGTIAQLRRAVPAGAADDIIRVAADLGENYSGILRTAKGAGLNIAQLSDPALGYAPRIITPDGLALLGEESSRGVTSRMLAPRDPSALARTEAFAGRTIREINEELGTQLDRPQGVIARALGLASDQREFFYTDPAMQAAVRGERHARAMGKAHQLNEMSRLYGRVRGGIELSPEITKALPALKNARFAPEVAGYLNRGWQKAVGPEELAQIVKGFDKLMSVWKRWTLLPFSAYHFRNMIGNWWNNYLVGVDAKWYATAMQLQRGQIKSLKLAGKVWSGDELIRALRMNRIANVGQFAVEAAPIRRLAEETGARRPGIARQAWRYTLGERQPLLRAGEVVGRGIENNARVANFLHHLDTGMDVRRAGDQVARALFNYDEVSEFTGRYAVRMMPFFRWARFNIPYQVKMVMAEPGKFAKLGKVIAGVRGETPHPEGTLPDFIDRGLGVPVQVKNGRHSYFLLKNWLPAGDLADIVEPIVALIHQGPREGFREILQPFLERLTPVVKGPAEYATNWSLFFRREIERYPGEKTEFLGRKLTRHQANLLRNIRVLNEFDRSFPWEQFGFDRRHRVDLSAMEKILRLLTGARLYAVEEARTKRSAEYQRRRRLGQLKAALSMARKQGYPDEIARLEEEIIGLGGTLPKPKRPKRIVLR